MLRIRASVPTKFFSLCKDPPADSRSKAPPRRPPAAGAIPASRAARGPTWDAAARPDELFALDSVDTMLSSYRRRLCALAPTASPVSDPS